MGFTLLQTVETKFLTEVIESIGCSGPRRLIGVPGESSQNISFCPDGCCKAQGIGASIGALVGFENAVKAPVLGPVSNPT
jgi:hypothetical protein